MRVDLNYPMSIRGITIQGDRGWPPNYIKKFKLRYSTNGTNFLYKTADGSGLPEVSRNLGIFAYSMLLQSISYLTKTLLRIIFYRTKIKIRPEIA